MPLVWGKGPGFDGGRSVGEYGEGEVEGGRGKGKVGGGGDKGKGILGVRSGSAKSDATTMMMMMMMMMSAFFYSICSYLKTSGR